MGQGGKGLANAECGIKNLTAGAEHASKIDQRLRCKKGAISTLSRSEKYQETLEKTSAFSASSFFILIVLCSEPGKKELVPKGKDHKPQRYRGRRGIKNHNMIHVLVFWNKTLCGPAPSVVGIFGCIGAELLSISAIKNPEGCSRVKCGS
jgi:hypothetical protein